MNHPSAAASPEKPSTGPKPAAGGLRLRIWFGCLAGAAVASLGLVWVVGTLAPFGGSADPVLLAVFPWAVGALGILTGIAMAMWLDYNIAGRLRGLARALASGKVSDLRGLPARAEWGELSEFAAGIQGLLARLDRLAQDAQEARIARGRLEAVHENLVAGLAHWAEGAGEALPSTEAPMAAIARILDRRLERELAAREENRDLALRIRAGLARGLEEARETETHAERGFVEATALLTTVRELQRLRGELDQALAGPRPGAPDAGAYERVRAQAAEAIEELITASGASVERLAAGLARVQEIADQVQTLGNRATLVALEAAIGGEPGATPQAGRAPGLQALAGDIQGVTARTAELSREIDREVATAIEHMRGLRERVSRRLESAPAPAGAAGELRLDPASRLIERVRDMVQEAMQSGERLSAAGERTSSAAQRLVRRLEEEMPALETLAARLDEISTPGSDDDASDPPRSSGTEETP